ncbi:MAG TPA: PilZ domain-containing protein, partial [Candidatus Polarisedimenticolia bacterium]|nr:PilZ domain-containing protein [Candidatus Polarisedimenticolia bacterium]
GGSCARETGDVNTGPDKRRHHRFRALLEVRIEPGDRIPVDLKLVTIDIAVGGARCASNHPLAAETPLKLNLSLVGGNLRSPLTIDADALVLRCTANPAAPAPRRYEVALEFRRIDAEDRRRLQDYLNAL